MATGAIYALVALGYTLVYGVLRLINFAHSEIFMIGTYGALAGVRVLGVDAGRGSARSGATLALVLLSSAVFGIGAGGLAAVALERVAYRPLRRRGSTRLAALISAIGASLFLQELFAKTVRKTRNSEPVPQVLTKHTWFTFKGADIRNDKVLVVLGAVAMMILLDRFVNGTRLGRGIRAVAQDPETATLMGVDIDRVVSLTFLLGGVMAGAAGMLFVTRFGTTKYDIGFLLGVKAFTAAVLGGIGNLRGALLGGFTLGVVEAYGSSIFGTQWADVVAFVILVVVLMFRPTGLLGESLSKARA